MIEDVGEEFSENDIGKVFPTQIYVKANDDIFGPKDNGFYAATTDPGEVLHGSFEQKNGHMHHLLDPLPDCLIRRPDRFEYVQVHPRFGWKSVVD